MTSKQTYRVCFCFRRRFRLAASEAPAEINSLFEQYSENGYIGVDNLHRFLVEIQKERNATVEDAHNIINKFGHHFFHRKGLNLELFFKYLFGDINPPTNPNIGVITFTLFFFFLSSVEIFYVHT